MNFDPWRDLPCALGGPAGTGRLRARPGDFRVEEVLPFEPAGRGEHLLLCIEAVGCNTAWLAGRLARWAGRPRADVGFAGLKDRHAEAVQWFSVRCPGGRWPAPHSLEIPGARLLRHAAHDRKLKRGALAENRFRIRVTELEADPERLRTLLDAVRARGVPNAFGPQRFGRQQANLVRAADWFSGGAAPRRPERGFLLSAARSCLFNAVLAETVASGEWERVAPGDPVQLDGRGSWFLAEAGDPDLPGRLRRLEVHPTGPLWGQGEPPGEGPARPRELAVAARFPTLAAGLARHGLQQERRALRLAVRNFQAATEPGALVLEFALPRGAFATAVLRELLVLDEPARGDDQPSST